MKAKELLDSGNLSGAVLELTQEVKSHPADLKLRTFLFELLCFTGDFERAVKQLDVVGNQSATLDIGVEIYRMVIKADQARRRLFSSGLRPNFLLDPPPYIQVHLDAVNRLRENNVEEAKGLLEQAASSWPTMKGQVDGQKFSEFRDADDLLAPILEVIINDSYTWIPLEQIKTISISPPKHLRDLLWVPGKLETVNGSFGIFLPVLYHGSSEQKNDQIKLGRMTEWKEDVGNLALGLGQRLILIDDQDRGMLEIREVAFFNS